MFLMTGLSTVQKMQYLCKYILMPVMANLGYFNYVLTLGVGSVLCYYRHSAVLTLGGLAILPAVDQKLQYAESRRVSQDSSTLYHYWHWLVLSVCLILLDEQEEVDIGYVTLVICSGAAGWILSRSPGALPVVWAWKHPPQAGRALVSYETLARVTWCLMVWILDTTMTRSLLHDY